MKRLALLLAGAFALLAALGAAAQTDPTATPAFGAIITAGPSPTAAATDDDTVDASTETAPPTQALLPTVTANAAEASAPAATTEGSSLPTATPLPDSADSRLAVCTAPTLPGFVPYIVRPGDRLADLLTGTDNLTVTQIAALNCLDDPAALPVGATLWLPAVSADIIGDILPAESTAVPDEGVAAVVQTAAIVSLEASSDSVQNEAGAQITWQASGAAAYFYLCPPNPNDECRRPVGSQPVPLNGSVIITNIQYAGSARYRLEVLGGDTPVTQDVTFEVTCSHQPLGTTTGANRCPDEPARSLFGVWQPFEGGVMMYFADTAEIWVMTNADNRVQVFDDTFVEGMDEPEIDAPEGRFAATRGFGVVWRNLGADDTARQPAGRISYTTYIQGPGTTVYAVTIVPGTDAGYWIQVSE
jgi:hypothetical protein